MKGDVPDLKRFLLMKKISNCVLRTKEESVRTGCKRKDYTEGGRNSKERI